jgi:hypothetical protein
LLAGSVQHCLQRVFSCMWLQFFFILPSQNSPCRSPKPALYLSQSSWKFWEPSCLLWKTFPQKKHEHLRYVIEGSALW